MNHALAPQPFASLAQDRFAHSTYLVRRKVFRLFGSAFHIYDPMGNVVFFSERKPFRLKDDIRLYTGEDMRTEVLRMRARQIFDFGATFDIVDSESGERIGALRRKALKSMIRDEWAILDASDSEIGIVQEDSMALALVRRFLSNLVPQTWEASLGGAPLASYHQHFNPFVRKVTVDFTRDTMNALDRRIGIAIAVLLDAVEGRQEQY